MKPIWDIRLFGVLTVERPGCTMQRFRTRKAGVVLAYLAYHCPAAIPRDTLVDLLWPDDDFTVGRQKLRVALASLRRQLEPPGVLHGAVLHTEGATVRLRPEAVTTDVGKFTDVMQYLGDGPEPRERRRRLEEAVRLSVAPFLHGCDEEWIVQVREKLHTQYLVLLRALARQCESDGDFREAEAYLRTEIGAQPLSEDAHRELIRFLHRVHGAGAAFEHYRVLEELLKQFDPAAAPTPLTRATIREVVGTYPRRDAGALAAAASDNTTDHAIPVRPASSPRLAPVRFLAPYPLPMPADRFFGREEEMATILEWARHDDGRIPVEPDARAPHSELLTLTGPGGIGKTRLAIQAAAAWEREQSGAIVFVPLGDITSADRVAEAILRAFGMTPRRGTDPIVRVAHAIAAQQQAPTLLILDNFEHVLDAAPVVIALLQRARGVRCLVTSRERLCVAPERELRVLPLAVPADPLSPEELSSLSSVRLFVDRAQKALPDFQITARNAVQIARLCARLEGLPLALELAAARAATLSPAAMLERLAHPLEFLASRARDVPPRHRTLRDAIAWSCRLLPVEAEAALFRLSVFEGGWTLEGAAAVLAPALDAQDNPAAPIADSGRTAEVLERLIEASLIQSRPQWGAPRFSMLEMVRTYAEDGLARLDPQATVRRHAEWYRALATLSDTALFGDDAADCLHRLSAEFENFRTALSRMFQAAEKPANRADVELGIGLTLALVPFWDRSGAYTEARHWVEEGLRAWEAAGEEATTADREHLRRRGLLLMSLSFFGWMQDDYAGAVVHAEESVALFRRAEDRANLARALSILAALPRLPRLPRGRRNRLFVESLRLSREMGDHRTTARTLWRLGRYRASLALYRQIGDREGEMRCLWTVAMRRLDRNGDRGEVRSLLEEALRLGDVTGHRQLTGYVIHGLMKLDLVDGLPDRALRRAVEALALFGQLGDRKGIVMIRNQLTEAALAQGNPAEAWDQLRQVLQVEAELGTVPELTRIFQRASRCLRLAGMGAEAGHLDAQTLALAHSANPATTATSADAGDEDAALRRAREIAAHLLRSDYRMG